jgi:tetratricopeptide (TPR) repeat protein
MMKGPINNQPARNPKRNLVFMVFTVVLPIVLLLLLEGLLRLAGYGDNLNLFVASPAKGYEKFKMVNPQVGKKYCQKFEYTAPANDLFLKDKPQNSFRIFVMGSSTVFGFPYDRNLMFSRILHHQLAETYPDKTIEVINTAITAINSFTQLDFIDQILDHQPDAILIYAGHNEFYGAFGIGSNETMSRNRNLTRLHIALMDFRIYQMIRNVITGTTRALAGNGRNKVHGTLMKRMAANKDILLDAPEYRIAMERYEQNMGQILQRARQKNIPVFLSDLVSNVGGMEPFRSVAGNNLDGALEVYLKAQQAEKNHDYQTAIQLYYKAKDLDCVRFRASEEVNAIVYRLANLHQARQVPMLAHFQNNAPNRIIGNTLMTEHVHPTIEGAFLMAEAFFTEVVKSNLMGTPNPHHNASRGYWKRNWGYTRLDSLVGHHRVQNLKGFWPFVMDPAKEVNHKQTYRPNSYLDSLAFSVIKNPERSLTDARLSLARAYEKAGQPMKAYREYEALVCMDPYVAINYRDAANCLLQLSDLPAAYRHYKKSLDYEASFYAWFRMGEIRLLMGDYSQALDHFEKAYPIAPAENRVNILAKSYLASAYGNKPEKTKALARELERLKAPQMLNIPEKKYVFSNYIPAQTKPQVTLAKQLLSDGKKAEALALLKSSLQVYDSHVANRMIGEIALQQENLDEAWYYYNKVHPLFKFDPQFLSDFIILCHTKQDPKKGLDLLNELKILNPGFRSLDSLILLIR